jgi:hypothetical protein
MKVHTWINSKPRKLLLCRACRFGRHLAVQAERNAMKVFLTILFFVLLGFAIVGLIHGNLFIVLTGFTAVRHDAQLSLVISVCAGSVVSLLYD